MTDDTVATNHSSRGDSDSDALLHRVLLALGPYREDVILIGGWVPYLYQRFGGFSEWKVEIAGRTPALLFCICASVTNCTAKPVSSSADTSTPAVAKVSRPEAPRDSTMGPQKPIRGLPLTWQPLPSGLSWNLVTSSPVMRGGKFDFSFVIRNATTHPIRAELAGTPSQGPIVEVAVSDRAGTEVWSNLHGQDLPFSRVKVPVPAHDSLPLTVSWDGSDNQGKKLLTGEYWVQGYLIPWVRNQPSVQSIRKRLHIP